MPSYTRGVRTELHGQGTRMDADTIAMLISIPCAGLVVLVLFVGAVLMVRDTVRRRGSFGINLKPVRCPECGEAAPPVRKPQNWRQTLWGGSTCPECGTEYDKWGRPVDDADGDARHGRSDKSR